MTRYDFWLRLRYFNYYSRLITFHQSSKYDQSSSKKSADGCILDVWFWHTLRSHIILKSHNFYFPHSSAYVGLGPQSLTKYGELYVGLNLLTYANHALMCVSGLFCTVKYMFSSSKYSVLASLVGIAEYLLNKRNLALLVGELQFWIRHTPSLQSFPIQNDNLSHYSE